jgi:hypothetical protein
MVSSSLLFQYIILSLARFPSYQGRARDGVTQDVTRISYIFIFRAFPLSKHTNPTHSGPGYPFQSFNQLHKAEQKRISTAIPNAKYLLQKIFRIVKYFVELR